MDTERRYRFEHNNTFNLRTAKQLVESHGYLWRETATLGCIHVEVTGPPNANLQQLDAKLVELGATLSESHQ